MSCAAWVGKITFRKMIFEYPWSVEGEAEELRGEHLDVFQGQICQGLLFWFILFCEEWKG